MGLTRSQAFPSRFLKHDDLNGKPTSLTIARVTIEELGAERERKPVVWFREDQRGLACNRVNWDTIADAYGNDSDGWTDRRIELYATKTSFGGRRVDCIRVRAPRDYGSLPLAEEQNDEIPV